MSPPAHLTHEKGAKIDAKLFTYSFLLHDLFLSHIPSFWNLVPIVSPICLESLEMFVYQIHTPGSYVQSNTWRPNLPVPDIVIGHFHSILFEKKKSRVTALTDRCC